MNELTTNKGIDYSVGLPVNIDTETGIRYGVIHMHQVMEAWCDGSEQDYDYICPKCSGGIDNLPPSQVKDETHFCMDCKEEFIEDDLEMADEPSCIYYNADGYYAGQDGYGDIVVEKAPFFTYAQFCSPCAPGACYLTNPVEPDLNNKCYCFGHDWFEDGKAPYPVYSVETGKEVPCPSA